MKRLVPILVLSLLLPSLAAAQGYSRYTTSANCAAASCSVTSPIFCLQQAQLFKCDTVAGHYVAVTGGTAGNPGGADTQFNFNDGGAAFGGSSTFTFNKATGVVTSSGGIALTKPIVSGTAPGWREIIVDPNGSVGSYTTIAAAFAYIASVPPTSAAPWVVRLLPGTYSQSAVLTAPSYTTVIGAGQEATTILRTSGLSNTLHSIGVYADPVIDATTTTNLRIENLSIVHTGTYTGMGPGQTFPVAIWTGASKRLLLNNVRLEGSAAGWYDKTDSVDNTFPKPVPGGKVGDEDWSYTVRNSRIIGHLTAGCQQIARHELYMSGTLCLVDIRASDPIDVTIIPIGFSNWEYNLAYIKASDFQVRSATTITYTGTTGYSAALSSQDSAVSNTEVHCEGCRFMVDLKNGDVNSSTAVVADVSIGNSTTDNTFRCRGCEFVYYTGTVTSARAIGGLFLWENGGTSVSGSAFISGSSFLDMGGSGGSARADVVVGDLFTLGQSRQPKQLKIDGSRITSWLYSSAGGSPTPVHGNFMVSSNTMNYQAGTATLSSGSVTVTLPLAYPAQATQVTDYRVSITCAADEVFNVTGKSNTAFTINSSNTASTAVCDWTVER